MIIFLRVGPYLGYKHAISRREALAQKTHLPLKVRRICKVVFSRQRDDHLDQTSQTFFISSPGSKAWEPANLLNFRNLGPNTMNPIGIGTRRTARQPSSVPAHWTPRFCIICFENSGNEQPIADRRMVLAAIVEAALDDEMN